MHETFGRGLVVTEEGADRIATIRFEYRGTKRIMTTIAPMWLIPSDLFWTPFYARRTWFEAHKENLNGLKPCPCCGYPLLTGERSFEWCSLCCWEDDGQDDHNADEVLGGPNSDLSLTEARSNFEVTLCAFRPDDREIVSLEICRPEHLPWKRRLLELYDRLIAVDTTADADVLWGEIESCWKEFYNRG